MLLFLYLFFFFLLLLVCILGGCGHKVITFFAIIRSPALFFAPEVRKAVEATLVVQAYAILLQTLVLVEAVDGALETFQVEVARVVEQQGNGATARELVAVAVAKLVVVARIHIGLQFQQQSVVNNLRLEVDAVTR